MPEKETPTPPGKRSGMNKGRIKYLALATLISLAAAAYMRNIGQAQETDGVFTPAIPKPWDDQALASSDLPPPDPAISRVHISADYYYRIPVRPIFKSYTVYAPGKEPPGYDEWLKQQEPETVFDASKL